MKDNEYKKGENKIEHEEIFDHGCFIDKNIGITFKAIEEEWIENDDGSMTRLIKKAELISVSIQSSDL